MVLIGEGHRGPLGGAGSCEGDDAFVVGAPAVDACLVPAVLFLGVDTVVELVRDPSPASGDDEVTPCGGVGSVVVAVDGDVAAR